MGEWILHETRHKELALEMDLALPDLWNSSALKSFFCFLPHHVFYKKNNFSVIEFLKNTTKNLNQAKIKKKKKTHQAKLNIGKLNKIT